jgi:integrase
LTPDELDRFLRAASKEGRKWDLVFSLVSYLALRVSEAATIRLEDFSDPPGFVTIQGLKHGLKRPYPLPEPLQRKLRLWLRERAKMPGANRNPYLFQHRDYVETGHLPAVSIQSAFYRIAKHAGLSPHSVHDLRHTVAQDLVRNKEGLGQVASWLRHKDIESSKIYIDHGRDVELDQRQVERASRRFK